MYFDFFPRFPDTFLSFSIDIRSTFILVSSRMKRYRRVALNTGMALAQLNRTAWRGVVRDRQIHRCGESVLMSRGNAFESTATQHSQQQQPTTTTTTTTTMTATTRDVSLHVLYTIPFLLPRLVPLQTFCFALPLTLVLFRRCSSR